MYILYCSKDYNLRPPPIWPRTVMALMAEHEAATEREREEAMLRTRGTNREDESDIGMTLAQFLSTYYSASRSADSEKSSLHSLPPSYATVIRQDQGHPNTRGDQEDAANHSSLSHEGSDRISQEGVSVIDIEGSEPRQYYGAVLRPRAEVVEGDCLPSYTEACSMEIGDQHRI